MQETFRMFGYVKEDGRRPEAFIAVGCTFYACYMFYWYLLTPITILLINDDDEYQCSQGFKWFIAVVETLQVIAMPFSNQMLFVGLIW